MLLSPRQNGLASLFEEVRVLRPLLFSEKQPDVLLQIVFLRPRRVMDVRAFR